MRTVKHNAPVPAKSLDALLKSPQVCDVNLLTPMKVLDVTLIPPRNCRIICTFSRSIE